MTGLSRPHRSRVAAIASGVTFGFRPRIRSGEPGIIRKSTKFRMTSRTIVKIACPTLLRTYRPPTIDGRSHG